MKKTSILTALSAALVGASLTLAGPAAAHEGGTGRPGPGASEHSTSAPAPVANAAPAAADRIGLELPIAPVGSDSSSTGGRVGAGIFTEPAPAAGTQKTAIEGSGLTPDGGSLGEAAPAA